MRDVQWTEQESLEGIKKDMATKEGLEEVKDVVREGQQRIEQMLEDRARKQAETADLEVRVREVAELDRDLTLAMTQLPDEKEIPDLLSAISNLGRESGLDIEGTLARSAERKTSLESVGSDCYVESFPDDEQTKKMKEIKAKKRRTIVRFLSFLDMRDTSERKSTMRSSISSVDWRSSIHMRDSIMQSGYSDRRKSDSIIETVDESLYTSPIRRSIRKSVRTSLKLFAFFGRKKNQVSPTPSMRGE